MTPGTRNHSEYWNSVIDSYRKQVGMAGKWKGNHFYTWGHAPDDVCSLHCAMTNAVQGPDRPGCIYGYRCFSPVSSAHASPFNAGYGAGCPGGSSAAGNRAELACQVFLPQTHCHHFLGAPFAPLFSSADHPSSCLRLTTISQGDLRFYTRVILLEKHAQSIWHVSWHLCARCPGTTAWLWQPQLYIGCATECWDGSILKSRRVSLQRSIDVFYKDSEYL